MNRPFRYDVFVSLLFIVVLLLPLLFSLPNRNVAVSAVEKRKLAEFPGVIALAAPLREPHRIARYLEELAGAYHKWYDNCRVTPRGDEPVDDAHRTRLWLNDATSRVIANGLDLLGVSAPERM